MRILLTGATGFVGHHVAQALASAGHEVVGCSRHRNEALHRWPDFGWIKADFTADLSADAWRPRLTGFQAVINTAGIVRERPGQSFEAVNFEAPLALFRACAERGPRRVIQLSAPDCERDPRGYAATKLRAERALAGLDLDWTIVRASLMHAEDLASAVVRLVEDGAPLGSVLELERDQIRFNVLHARDAAKLHRAL
ncbi:MAG TPA: NAD-dependent epimerase/dehydratase family protein [Burkholderiales bacterium]|jgi:nucleoside-diphosphate-sugar epimerase|nr:NAD-dependent epimerase/dehydratase family protein [Burkholderiales bacterium]